MEEYELHRKDDCIVISFKSSLTPFCRHEEIPCETLGRLEQLSECNIGNIDEFNREYMHFMERLDKMLFAIYKGLSWQRYLFQHNLLELYQLYKDS